MATPVGNGYTILLMNTGKDGKEPAPAKKRQKAFKKVVEDIKPSIIFLQETTTMFVKELLDLQLGYHGIRLKGDATMVPAFIVDGNFDYEDLTSNTKITALIESLKRQKSSSPQADFSEFASGRFRLVKFTSVGKPDLEVLALSWHGPHKMAPKKKVNLLKALFVIMKKIRAVDDDKFRGENRKPLPVIVGGDFNLERSLWPTDPDLNFVEYEPSDRRKGRIIDMFVSTKDLDVKGVKYFDMHFKLEDGTEAADLLKHDPIEGVLAPKQATISRKTDLEPMEEVVKRMKDTKI